MSEWPVAALCAASAGALAFAAPALLHALPTVTAGSDAQESSRALGDVQRRQPRAAVGAPSRWLVGAAVVVSTAAAGVLGLVLGPDRVLVGLVPLVPVAFVLAVSDVRSRLLPRGLVLSATVFVAALLILEWAVTGDLRMVLRACAGLVLARSFFWLLWFFTGVGFGDVRLAALVGLVTARVGWEALALGLYAGLALAGFYALIHLLARRRRGRPKASVPLGPFLLAGAWIGVLGSGIW